MDHYQDEITDNDSSRSPDEIDVIVGMNLRRIRRARGLSQEKLAKAMGLTFQALQKYERGSTRIGASRLVKLSRALSINPADLLSGTGAHGHGAKSLATDMLKALSPRALELAMTYDAIVSPSQRSALRMLARTMAQAED